MNIKTSLVCSLSIIVLLFFGSQAIAQEVNEPKAEPVIEKSADEKDKSDQVTSDTKTWETISPSGALAEFKMPVKPRLIERTLKPVESEPPIKVRMHLASANQGRVAFVFNYHDLHRVPESPEDVVKILQGAVIGSIANVVGKKVSQKQIRYNEFLGIEFVYQYAQYDKIYRVAARTFVVGARQYQISCLMEANQFDEELAKAFLSSFRLLPAKPEKAKPPATETPATEPPATEPPATKPPATEADAESNEQGSVE